jgi:hypothetical protein
VSSKSPTKVPCGSLADKDDWTAWQQEWRFCGKIIEIGRLARGRNPDQCVHGIDAKNVGSGERFSAAHFRSLHSGACGDNFVTFAEPDAAWSP